MKTKRSIILKFAVIVVSLSFLLSGPLTAGMTMKHGEGGHGMSMHHQQSMLIHALMMALDGSNLFMLGQMGMAAGVDAVSVEHGKTMIKHARSLYNNIMTGKTMTDMHGKGTSPEKDSGMAYTHKLASAQLKIIDLLKMMPTVTE